MSTDLQRAKDFFREQGLEFPQIPDQFLSQLREYSPTIYSTRELQSPPYDMEVHVQELFDSQHSTNYALLAVDGHGVNSWAFHYFLLDGPLALFIQLPWGSAYTQTENARKRINQAIRRSNILSREIGRLERSKSLPTGRRLVVVVSPWAETRWAWIDVPLLREPNSVDWSFPENIFDAVDEKLKVLAMR